MVNQRDYQVPEANVGPYGMPACAQLTRCKKIPLRVFVFDFGEFHFVKGEFVRGGADMFVGGT